MIVHPVHYSQSLRRTCMGRLLLCSMLHIISITHQVLNYFASLDVPIMEVFGQSECSGPHTSNYPHAWKVGTIGQEVC